MTSILLMIALNCPITKIDNVSKEPWGTVEDMAVLAQSKRACQYYYKDAPCVKLVRKKGDNVYNVVCGGSVDKSS